jgi:DNA polymerase-1
MKLIIDGDMFLYRASFSTEVEIKWDEDTWTLHSSEKESQHSFDSCLMSVVNKLDKDAEFILAFSDTENYRYDIFPNYKSNRKNTRKPLGLKALREWAIESYDSRVFPRLEADDVCGIMATEDPTFVAVSGDKDFGTLPITWYNMLRDEMRSVTPEEADKFHLIQTLAGDPTDGYMGVKGIGTKTAEKILEKDGYNWETVVATYEKAGLTEDDALVTARLARILRDEDYDGVDIKLWTP